MHDRMQEPIEIEDFLDWKPTYPKGIIGDGILYEMCKVVLYGRYKSLKSMAAMELCLCLRYGYPWLGFTTPEEGVSTLYVQLEMPPALFHKRLNKMHYHWLEAHGLKPRHRKQPMYLWSINYLKLDTTSGLQQLADQVKKLKPGLVILDPLYKVLSGNILDPNQVRVVADSIDKFISEHKVAVMLAHHTRKSALDEDQWGTDDMLGAGVFSWWADSVIKLTRKEEKNNQINLTLNCDVARYAEEELPIRDIQFDRKTMLLNAVEPAIQV